MRFHILTLFPEMVEQGLHTSILGRAMAAGLIEIEAVNIRDYTLDKHHKVDDYPYGGGAGMLMQAQPVFDACQAVQEKLLEGKKARVVYLTPQGSVFTQKMAEELSKEEDLILLCGHYEGIDERVLEEVVTDEISIGDYVLTGGELAAMVMTDAIARLVPGVLNNQESARTESFQNCLLEYPQYSRPETWREKEVPPVLLSGNHKEIRTWRLEKAKERTRKKRPDLYREYERIQEAIAWLGQDKLLHMDMIEPLRTGFGELAAFYPDGILIKETRSGIWMHTCRNKERGIQMLQELSEEEKSSIQLLVLHQDTMLQPVETEWGMRCLNICYQVVYTRKNPLSVRKDLVIRPLGVEYLPVIRQNYQMIQEEEIILERLQKEKIFGAFLEKELTGFIGEHQEGGMGMLEVFKPFRGKGIGMALESFLINRMLLEDKIPYGQLVEDNENSHHLQEKLGLRISKNRVYWCGK